MAIPLNKIRKLHLLLNRLNMNTTEDKEMFAFQFSNERTLKTSELMDKEYDQLINRLQSLFLQQDACNAMRRKIISRAHEMSWTVVVDDKIKADMNRINDWCIKYGYLHKDFNKYTEKELPCLVTQFDNVFISYLKCI